MRARWSAAVVLAALFFAGAAAADEAGGDLQKEREAGAAFFAHFRQSYGLSENKRYQALANEVLYRLCRASGERPELQWHVAVLKYAAGNPVARNASAWPGGYIITDDAFMRLMESAAGKDQRRFEGLVAGVMAHEVGHVINHDTDALVRVYFQEANAEPARLANTLTKRGSALRTRAAEQRRREWDADRAGAFYLLRAGYSIKDMIAVFERMAREEIGEVLFTSELDHAKSADRVANLLRMQAEVMEDQTRFDEAVTVLKLGLGGGALDDALRNLELVRRHFPSSTAVCHAVAVAYHRKYLESVPASAQAFRPAFAFYQFRALRAEEAPPPDLESLRKAAEAYQEILARGAKSGFKGLDPTVGAYALVLAQLGNVDEALEWARRAVVLAPGSWQHWNTLGNAFQVKGDVAQAAGAYGRALSVVQDRYRLDRVLKAMYTSTPERAEGVFAERVGLMEFAPALFNLASACRLADKKEDAVGLFRLYAALDRDSEWNAVARAQLAALGAPERDLRFTEVAGVRVASDRKSVEALLGAPEAQGKLDDGTRILKYLKLGLHVYLDPKERVTALVVDRAFTGDLGGKGVTLGMPAADLRAALGIPIARQEVAPGVEAQDYPPYGVTLFVAKGVLARAVVYGRPEEPVALTVSATSPAEAAAFVVSPGDTTEQVRAALGAPDHASADGAWIYQERGVRVRFGGEGKAAMVVVSKPCADAVAGIRLGDPASRVQSVLGEARVTPNFDDTTTYAYPGRSLAYVVRDGQVVTMTLYQGAG